MALLGGAAVVRPVVSVANPALLDRLAGREAFARGDAVDPWGARWRFAYPMSMTSPIGRGSATFEVMQSAGPDGAPGTADDFEVGSIQVGESARMTYTDADESRFAAAPLPFFVLALALCATRLVSIPGGEIQSGNARGAGDTGASWRISRREGRD